MPVGSSRGVEVMEKARAKAARAEGAAYVEMARARESDRPEATDLESRGLRELEE